MKRILIIVLALSAASCAWSQKLGHINSQELLENMPGRDAKMQEYEAFRKQHEDLLLQMQAEYQKMIEEYQNEGANWPEAFAQTKLETIGNQERQIGQFQEQASQDLMEKENALFQPLLDEAKKAIEEVAAENGYTYVFDSQALLYMGGGDDILPLVKTKLGITD